MALLTNSTLRALLGNTIICAMAGTWGTGGTASMSIYSGTQPTTAGDTPTGTLLCTMSGIGWAQSSSGTTALVNEFGYNGTAVATGTCGWARMETVGDDGTSAYVIDGDVGTSGTSTFLTNNKVIASGDVVLLRSVNIVT